jgi:hypothetical protein
MNKIIIGALLFGLTLAGVAEFRGAAANKYELSEIQKLRLEVKQKDAQLAQQNLSFAQQAFQQRIADFNAEAQKVEQENGWPSTVKIDPNTLTFSDPPAAPAVGPVKQPAAK